MSRRKSNIGPKHKLLIVTNGSKTERNYFNLIKEKRSVYNINIKIEVGSPKRVVEFALNYLNQFDEIWCVFDIDNSMEENQLLTALRLAKQNNINIAYSNLSFEVWLISHFRECSSFYKMKDLIEILNLHLKKFNKKLEYNKNDEAILKKYFLPNYKEAIQNAKVVLQNRINKYGNISNNITDYPIHERNSSTSVHLLLEKLNLRK